MKGNAAQILVALFLGPASTSNVDLHSIHSLGIEIAREMRKSIDFLPRMGQRGSIHQSHRQAPQQGKSKSVQRLGFFFGYKSSAVPRFS